MKCYCLAVQPHRQHRARAASCQSRCASRPGNDTPWVGTGCHVTLLPGSYSVSLDVISKPHTADAPGFLSGSVLDSARGGGDQGPRLPQVDPGGGKPSLTCSPKHVGEVLLPSQRIYYWALLSTTAVQPGSGKPPNPHLAIITLGNRALRVLGTQTRGLCPP
jgi:hypothetical protein